MALAIDGTASNTMSGGSSTTVTLTTVNTGDIIVVAVHQESTGATQTVSNITATGLSFAKRASQTLAGGGNADLEYWWAYAAAALTSAVITITLTGSIDDCAAYAFGVTGFTGTSYQTNPWDGNASLGQASANTSASGVPTTKTFSTTASATMILALIGSTQSGGPSADSPLTTLTGCPINNTGGTNFSNVSGGDQVVAAAQTNITRTFGGGSSQSNWICFADALSQVGGPGAGLVAPLQQSLAFIGPTNGPLNFRTLILPGDLTSHTGAANLTEDNDTLSAAGTVANFFDPLLCPIGTFAPNSTRLATTFVVPAGLPGSASLNEADDTLSAAGTVLVTGTANLTEDADTLSAAGTVLVTGTANLTEDADTLSAAGAVLVSGTANLAEDPDTLSATASLLGPDPLQYPIRTFAPSPNYLPLIFVVPANLPGSASLNEDDDSLSAAGTTTGGISGAASLTETDDTLSASGTVLVTGTASLTEDADTLSAVGTALVTGTANLAEDPDTLAATGTVATAGPSTGTALITEADDSLSATGTATQPAPPPQTGGGGGGGGGEWIYEEPRRPEKKKKKKKDEPAPTPEVVMGPVAPQILARVVSTPEPLPMPPGLVDLNGDQIAKLVLEQQQRKLEAEAKAQRDYDDALALLLLTS